MQNLPETTVLDAIASGSHGDPFAVFGMHEGPEDGHLFVRTFQPHSRKVEVIDAAGNVVAPMERIHSAGVYQADLGKKDHFKYRLRLHEGESRTRDIEDPYRFWPVLGELDVYLFAEGSHLNIYEKLGAHLTEVDGVPGVVFAVWAPNARRVSIVGNFNMWDGRVHPMRLRVGSGVWELFVPHLDEGEMYKYEIKGADGNLLPLKTDPVGFYSEKRPSTASVVHDLSRYRWKDDGWEETRRRINSEDSPMSIYEVHLGSFRRNTLEGQRYLTYRELADELVPYVKELGFSHIELMPVTEHPFDGSWGYQTTGMFSPTSRFGTPDEFKYFVDVCHQNEIGVLLDWVPGHFPKDSHGLGWFDGTHLYEHADWRKGEHKEWGTLIYNFGRREVGNFLVGSALFWLNEYHIDGLRIDAVASMLYLDYNRKEGEWVANEHGGNEHIEAVHFLRRLNEVVYGQDKGYITIAEESTAWPMVSRPTYMGGLGFGYKWNMGWMNDTLEYISEDPVHRRYHHNKLTFGPIYAFNENFILPLSHDEVVHGKGSLYSKVPGDRWQKFANLRTYFGFMYTHPGKKLLFMGDEFAQDREWSEDYSISWHLLDDKQHKGMQMVVRALNRVYRENPALHEVEFEGEGFEWIDFQAADNGVISYLRKARDPSDFVVVVCNFTPVPRENYRVGVPRGGTYREIFNSDATLYGGSGMGNLGKRKADSEGWNFRSHSLTLTIPPLATLVLAPQEG